MPARPHITKDLFQFLVELKAHNDKAWFAENKKRYEEHVKAPLLAFIGDIAPHLEKISPHLRADPRPVGGSLFRIHRDVRFSKDKSPYKTHAAVQFRHAQGKDVHAPGLYLHLEPGSVFFGGGMWHPESAPLKAIRTAIAERPEEYKKIVGKKSFKDRFELQGESLTRPPKGFDADHPLIDEIKRKDFIGITTMSEDDALSPQFMKLVVGHAKAAAPLMEFLARANDLPF